MADQLHTPAQSGRELSRARRRAMSRTGAANIKAGGSASRVAGKVAVSSEKSSPAKQQAVTADVEMSTKPLTGRALSILRRAMLAKGGKSALAATAVMSNAVESQADTQQPKACCEACANSEPCTGGAESEKGAVVEDVVNGEALDSLCEIVESSPKGATNASSSVRDFCRERRSMLSKKGKLGLPAKAGRPARKSVRRNAGASKSGAGSAEKAAVIEDVVNSEALNSLCGIVENSPEGSTNASSSVRDFCRERRSMLSKKGKLGLSGKAGRQARKSVLRSAATSSLTSKALAKLHREDRCQFGRGDTPACRPSGRVRPDSGDAPPKVEEGTTLSGQVVTGTQVEQTEKVTGTEPGACRAVTGTEYLGVEQFTKFCPDTPLPAAAKVGLSETGQGQLLTGSNTAGSNKVTGDETGHCKSVTGSEYLGAEHFDAFCSSHGISKTQGKVIAGRSEKNLRITGADEARDNAVTGSESESASGITGSNYANAEPRKSAVEAPAKVAMSHTAAGMSISGGELSRVAGITGDEQDLCRRVTGTEYISSERFQAVCGTAPEGTVAKVGVDTSHGGMSITGNLVYRSEKITGNEPGSCQRVTGSQYGEAARADLCDKRSSKVYEMHTSQGRTLTGTEASPSPKSTGDVRGGCAGITGSEYVSQEYFEQSCPQTPVPGTKMTGMSRTWNNQVVSGAQTGHSQKVTGDEPGICKTVTGSSYAGREQVSEFCPASALAEGEQRLRQHDDVPTMPVSGITPGADKRMAGNFQRGTCQNLTGTPYQGPQDGALCSAGQVNGQPARAMHHLAQAPIDQAMPRSPAIAGNEAVPYKASFSVASPAKTAWQQRENEPVHSSVYARRGSITGVVNKAEGVISGTPEFRHQRELEPVDLVMPTAQPETVQREKITGEGSESGAHITGDDWSRGGSVTGTEGMFSAKRNQTQQGASVERKNIGAYALKDRERPEVKISRVTGSSGGTGSESVITLSGGASG